jgi:hypothetical protein
MPGFILTAAGAVTCSHPPGKGTPTLPASRVSILGAPAITLAVPYAIAGCALTGSGPPICTLGKFTVGALRVKSMLQPLVIMGSTSTCVATAQPMIITATQTRVSAA